MAATVFGASSDALGAAAMEAAWTLQVNTERPVDVERVGRQVLDALDG